MAQACQDRLVGTVPTTQRPHPNTDYTSLVCLVFQPMHWFVGLKKTNYALRAGIERESVRA